MRESQFNIWVERTDSMYVFNGVSGALLKVTKPDYLSLRTLLAGGAAEGCSPNLVANMVAGSMLVSDNRDELDGLARRYRSSRESTSHFALTIVTSLGCNFDCPYCFEAKHPSILDRDVEAMVLDALDEQLTHIKSFHVTWFGGEPLVGRKPLLSLSDNFIARCESHAVHYEAAIVTNGYLLDEQTCVMLRDRRVTSVQVGLDGPPDVHNRMRPLAGGRESFDGILQNLQHAAKFLNVAIRVNIDHSNSGRVDELFQLLVDAGLAGKLTVYPGQIVGTNKNLLAPSASYHGCLTNPEFAAAEHDFYQLAARYGLAEPSLPRPTGAPCTAVRRNELVVGSSGELYKCWDSVGASNEVIGHIRDYYDLNGRLAKWMDYDPFSNVECRACLALPVCMGGCAHHAFDNAQYENRCGTFRHTYKEQVNAYVNFAEERDTEGITNVATLHRAMAATEASTSAQSHMT